MKHIKKFESYTVGDDESGFETHNAGNPIIPEPSQKQFPERGDRETDLGLRYRRQLKDNDTIDRIKNTIDEMSPDMFNKMGDFGPINMVANWAGERMRKDAIQYLFDKGLLKSDQLFVLDKWVGHSSKLSPEQKEEMKKFIRNISGYPIDRHKSKPWETRVRPK